MIFSNILTFFIQKNAPSDRAFLLIFIYHNLAFLSYKIQNVSLLKLIKINFFLSIPYTFNFIFFN